MPKKNKPEIPEDERYDRQAAFAPIGSEGQARLRKSTAVVIGCGGLGSHIVEKLARAGVGTLRIVDPDKVEGSNLQRQALYDTQDATLKKNKAEAAIEHLRRINPDVHYEAIVGRVVKTNVREQILDADVVLDGLDNLATRFIINDACREMGIPFVHGGAVGAEGEVMVILPDEGPCLRGVFESGPDDAPAPTCMEVGIIGTLVQYVASLQTTEALKILTGNRENVSRDLLRFNLWENSFQRLPLSMFSDA